MDLTHIMTAIDRATVTMRPSDAINTLEALRVALAGRIEGLKNEMENGHGD